MRAYILHKPVRVKHPEGMKLILDYLRARGTLNIQPATVEKYNFEFSEVKYSASWIGVDLPTLEEFAEWLSEQEV